MSTSYVGCSAAEMMDNLNIQVFLCPREGRVKTRTGYGVERPATMYEQRLYRQKLLNELEASLTEEIPA
jgi:hypothetical protein